MFPPESLSSSLPSGFRCPVTRQDSSVRHSRSFYARSGDQSELPVPTVDSTLAKTRLEVLKAWEVNVAVLCLYAAAALALLYTVFNLEAVRSSWEEGHVVPPLTTLEEVFRWALQAASFLLPLFFVGSLVLHGSFTDEQIWTCVLLAVGLLASNPLTRTTFVSKTVSAKGKAWDWFGFVSDHALKEPVVHSELIWNDAIYTAVIYLYLLLAAHSYRVFDVKHIHSLSFYAPKFAVALLYLLVKVVVGFKADVSLGLVPYARIITWLILVESGRASLRVTIPVLLTTVMDTAFGFWLVSEVATTADFLATVPYVEHRSKQLGFRCFVYQTLAFCFNMIGLSMLITYMLPRGFIFAAYDDPNAVFFQLEPPVARLALAFVYFAWTLVLAYVNLPPQPVLPFVTQITNRCLFQVRNSRVAMWLGLADIVSTEDAEDSSDEDEDNADTHPEESSRSFGAFRHPPILNAKETIPFRYCHRELFDYTVQSPRNVTPISPLLLNESSSDRIHSFADICYDGNALGTTRGTESYGIREEQESKASYVDTPMLSSLSTHVPPSPDVCFNSSTPPINISGTPNSIVDLSGSPEISRGSRAVTHSILRSPPSATSRSLAGHRKLRIRKNLFVTETQVMMANAAYLSYIPGNRKEELVRPKLRSPNLSRLQTPLPHTGSLAYNLDELARQIDENNASLYGQRPSCPNSPDVQVQPAFDDGSRFLVDPYEISQRYGYRLHKHFVNEKLNTHAVVLVNSSRVIVAFSGTRDVTNWGVNANIHRVVLDDKLSRFEFVFDGGSDSESVPTSEDDDHWHLFEAELENRRFGRGSNDGSRSAPIPRSRSEERLSSRGSPTGPSNTLLTKSGARHLCNYGTVNRSIRNFDSPSQSTEGPAAFGFATQEGVTRVANTFARELLTFGKPKVHEGFIDAYMSLRKQVMGALVELYKGRPSPDVESGSHSLERIGGEAEGLPLFLSGHSLGGALATFASYEAARYFKRIGLRRRQDIACTTFGCPKLGNEAFKARYERLVETHWRFEIASDPIPKVPIILLNYVHVGVHVLMDQSGGLLIDPSFIEVQWWGLLSNLYLGYRLHTRASYCMALRTYCKRYKNGCDDLSDRFWPFPIRVQTNGLFHHAGT